MPRRPVALKRWGGGKMGRDVRTAAGLIRVARCGLDDSYILDWCPWRELSDIAARGARRCNPAYRAFNANLHGAYGGHAVAAWDGSQLVGMVTFFPEGAVRVPAGWEYPRPCGLDISSCLAYAPELDLSVQTDIIVMGCVGLHIGSPRYRRRGLATAMVLEVLEWARAGGYRLVKAYARPDGGSAAEWDRNPDPEAGFWQRAGFVRAAEVPGGQVVMVRPLDRAPCAG